MHDTIARAAAALRAGSTTSVALVATSLEAVRSHQPRTNAFTAIHADDALASARRLDAERAQGVDRGPLHGIPISLKDIIDVGGRVTTAGSRVLADRVAGRDAAIVTRLTDAGAIVIGRTNLHEFALGTTSEDSAFGPVRHPDDPARSPGGSSGGSAAAVATGMGLASIGTDTGGSVRIPSAICGVVGLKASCGEIPTDGVIPLSPSFDHVGPLARTVQDAAWLYQAMAGRRISTVVPATVTGLRLAILTGYFSTPVDRDVRDAFKRAVARLTDAGTRLATAEIADTAEIMTAYVNVVLPEAAAWHAPFLDERRRAYTPVVGARIAHGRTIGAVSYLEAREFCARLRASVDRALDEHDALILPTLPIVAPLLGTSDVTIDPETSAASTPVRNATLRHTQPFNMTGHPAISLPIDSRGLPVGFQIVGRRNETTRLVEIAAACEAIFRAAEPAR